MSTAQGEQTTTAASHDGGRLYGALPLLGIALPGRRALLVWRRHWTVFLPKWPTELVAPMFEPIVVFMAIGLGLGAYVEIGEGTDDYIRFLAPGVLGAFPVFDSTWDALFGSHRRLHEEGTYEAILATPIRAEEAITGDALWAATRAVLSAALIFIVVLALTPRYELVTSPFAILAVATAGLTGLIFAGLSLAVASRARSMSQLGSFFTLVVTPMFWFSGGFFPLDDLPMWARVVGWFVPIAHNVELNRDLMGGEIGWATLGHLVWLLAAMFAALWFGLRMMRSRLIPA